MSGDAFAVYYHELAVGYGNPVGIGDTLSIVANSGGLFTFDSVGYRGWGGHFSDGIDIYGLVDGGRTESLSIYSSSEIYVTQLGFGSGIDELQIVGASQGDRELLLDNFVLAQLEQFSAAAPFIQVFLMRDLP